MLTGQISSHALQLVHAQISSGVMRSNTLSAPIGDVAVRRRPAATRPGRRSRPSPRRPSARSRAGRAACRSSCAGHTDVQRPQIVHASVSNSCFHVKSSIFTAPKLSSSVSMRFGIGFIAPLGRSRSLQVHVHRRREHVAQLRGRQDREEREERDDVHAPQPPVHVRQRVRRPGVDRTPTSRVADERPLLEGGLALERDAYAFDEEPGEADDAASVPRITASSGLVLMRMRYGRCT